MRYTVKILFMWMCAASMAVLAVSTPLKAVSRLTEAQKRQFSYYYIEALRLKENEQYDQALENLQICLDIDSLSAGAHSQISTLYLSIGMRDESIHCLEKALQLEPNNWWYFMQLITTLSDAKFYKSGEEQLYKNNLLRAIEITKTISKKYPNKEEVYRIQGNLYAMLDMNSDAIKAYNQLEKMTSVRYETSLMKFRLLAQQHKKDEAIKELDKLINKNPLETYYKIIKGDAYLSLNLPDKAFEIYQLLYKTEPNNAYLLVSLSNYYKFLKSDAKAREFIVLALKSDDLDYKQKTGILGDYVENYMKDSTKFGETESLFKLLVEKYPLEEEVHDYYSAFLMIQKRNREACNELETMININEHNQGAWLRLIDLNLTNSDTIALITNTSRAITEFPKEPVWYYYRGMAYRMKKEYENTINDYQKGLTLTGQAGNKLTADFYAGLAEAYYEKKDYEKTFDFFEKSIIAEPSNIMNLNNYAYYLSEQKKDLRKAEKMSAKTVEKNPKNSTFLDTYAWIFYQQGNYSLAKYYIERAIDNLDKESRESDATVYDHYGDILWMLKTNDDKALEMWKKSFQISKGVDSEKLKQKIDNKGWKRD